ncbi:telomerase-binding protein EST1A isoform X6 [Bos javanicus]|uniref:telomerase-binding protein EST1A isoform X6 n=1 Tax=Bos javanicus TaxID=9906 RepID=UPI002AA63399|nr:telomerase-binding protein EST1A isoform X6 [Bos javanicus]
MRSSQGSLCHTIGWEAWCWWQVGGRSHGHGGAATLQHIWPPQCFLLGMAFTTCELQIQGEPLSSLGECPPRREERTPEVREEERAREGAKQVIAADCKRVTVLKYFLEALCGQEEPLLAFKGGKYVSVAPVPDTMGKEMGSQEGKQLEDEEEDVVIEDFEEDSEAEGSGGEDDIRELRAKKLALARKIAEQQRRQEKIQAVLEDQSHVRQMELEIRPLFLVPDTNGFIDHLASLAQLLESRNYILVVPLIVINELDGLAKGQETDHRAGGYARVVQEKARKSIEFLERRFESRDSCLRALTSRGNELESIAFRSEDITGQLGNNDDLILSCCLHYCKDKAKDFMPTNKEEPIRLLREVVLLTDDRNLRVKALTRNVPVRDIPAFLTWAQVG